MSAWKVPLADVVVDEADIEAVADTYRSGWLSMGPRTEEFEQALAEHGRVRHAIATANGTAALHLACAAAGLGPGDEVVVPSMTFVATANAVAYTGATPVFADIAALTSPWLSVESVERALTPRTRAVMTTAYGGHPGDVVDLAAFCTERGLTLLEDAAHAIGSRVGDKQVGSFGLAGAYSFFSNKNLAVGEGGAVITDDDEAARRIRLLRSHGMTTLTWDRHRGHASSYDVVDLGFNYRIDEPRAAFGVRRLAALEHENGRRGELVERYRQLLADVDAVEPTEAPVAGTTSAHHLFTVVLAEGVDRDAFRAQLADARIQTSVHYPPAHRFSIYASQNASLRFTDAYGARAVTLPLFAHMTEEQQDLVVAAVVDAAAVASAR